MKLKLVFLLTHFIGKQGRFAFDCRMKIKSDILKILADAYMGVFHALAA